MTQKVVIMQGISGAGKSTYVQENCQGYVVASMDDFRKDETGQYRYGALPLQTLKKLCFERFMEGLEAGKNVVVDNMSTSHKYIRYVDAALKWGAEVEIVTLLVDPDVATARSTHAIPPESNRKHHEALLIDLPRPLPDGVKRTTIDRR